MADIGGGQPPQPPAQPTTVLVKKADGTFERKSLDELKGVKNQPAPVAVPAQTPPLKVMPASALSAMLADDDAPAPAKPVVAVPQASPSRENQVEEILTKAKLGISSTVENRLRTLIQLRLKDARTTDQVEEAMQRSEEEGGVGLTDEQIETVLRLLPGGLVKKVDLEKELPAVATPNNSFIHAPIAVQAIPAKAVTPIVAATPTPVVKPVAPVQPIVAAKPALSPAPIAKPIVPVQPMDKQRAINTFAKNADEPFFKIPPQKSAMQDITSKSMAIGPTDEIRVFTLTDFRRLSTNPEEGAMRFKQKFLNLKDESILLYMEGLDAWKHSPFYAEYMAVVLGSLAGKQPLTAVSSQKNITFNEIKAIIGMEKQLDYV